MAEYSIVSILPVLSVLSKLAAKHYSAERPSFVLETSSLRLHVRPLKKASPKVGLWFELRGQDLNLRPRGYEPRELPGCSTPRRRLY